MKLKLIIFTLCFFATIILKAQSNEVIIVKIQEANWMSGLAVKSFLWVSYPDSKVETIELEKILLTGKGNDSNLIIINKKTTEILNKGYYLQSTSTGGGGGIDVIMMVFTKKI